MADGIFVCARAGVEITDYEKHLIKVFSKFLGTSNPLLTRCPWCCHKLKNHGKCKICDCQRGKR